MMRSIVSLLAVGALVAPARAQPCNVAIARAPDDVRAAIEQWLRDEPRCSGSLEVRVVATPGGLYLFARDGRGLTRERTVPDAVSVAALVASWAADDSIDGAWIAAAPPPLPPPELPAPPPAHGRGLQWTGLAIGVAGVAAFATGFIYGVRAEQISNAIAAHPPTEPWPADIHDLEARGQSYETNEKVLLATGGVLAVSGTVMYLLGRARAERWTIVPSRSGAGVAGRF